MMRVAIIGGGSIGVAFAIVFARAGHAVIVQEPDAGRRDKILDEIAPRLSELDRHSLIRENPATILARIGVTSEVEAAVAGTDLVQECGPEDRDLKRTIFGELDRLTPQEAVLASASSAIPISKVTADLPGRHRTLVAHPGNPPYLLPVIELVPSADTDAAVVARARAFYEGCGMTVVTLGREIEGFVFNRLQGALLREAYCLVRDGIATVEEIDDIVSNGLGLRWSVIGPFETVDLNTRGGIADHARKMGPAYARMGAERGQHDPWTPDLVELVTKQRRALTPEKDWEARVAWRDQRLMELLAERAARSRA
jgi:3-hydroxyacyl-CoA dehydrogenase